MAGVVVGGLAVLIAALMWLTSRPTGKASPAPAIEVQNSVESTSLPAAAIAPAAGITEAAKKMNTKISSEDVEKIKVLHEILSSKNDNDPRLDSDFKNLSAEMKQALAETYASLPRESRNQKGTVVFLLGRSISSAADVSFLSSVLSEPPCLSLENCSRSPNGTVDEHASMSNDITVVYPQLVAVKSIGRFLNTSSGEDAGLVDARKAAIAALENAVKSDQQRISAAAALALQNLGH